MKCSPAHAALVTTLIVCGCGGSDSTPSIRVQSVSPKQLELGADATNDLLVTLHYSDGDGDLGGGVVTIIDCRDDGLALDLPIPTIASDANPDVEITGTLDLTIADIGAVTPGDPPVECESQSVDALADDEVVFCLEAIDIAGNRSQAACTPSVAIADSSK